MRKDRGISNRPSAGSSTRLFGLRVPFYGWAIVAVGALITFCSGPGQSYVFSVFIDSLIADTGITRTSISALYAVGTGVSALGVALVSRLVDRYGARLILIAIALALGIACFGMSAATGPITILLGFAALRTLGQGSMPITATLLAAQWFVRYRGRAMAIVGLGLAASNAVLPSLAQTLIDGLGWRSAYMVLGVMVWALIIPTALLIVRNRPEDIGLHPDGASPPSTADVREAPSDGSGRPRRVLTSLRFWHLAIPLAAPAFIVTALVFHQTSIFEEHGLSRSVAAGVFVAYAIAAALASTLAGFAIERLGPKRLFLGNLGVLLVALLTLQTIASPLGAALYATILGTSSGTQQVINGVTWAHYYGRQGLGRVQGSAMMVMISSTAVAPLPLAYLRDLSGSYGLGLTVMAVIPLVCTGMVALFRPPTPTEPSQPA